MSRIIIENKSDLTLSDTLLLVKNVVDEGRVSNEGRQHCYLTAVTSNLGRHLIATILNPKSEKFIVYNDNSK